MTKRDYYEVIEVEKTATIEEITQSFRRLSKKWHPDKNHNNKEEAEEKFKELVEAKEVLCDDQKREIYDRHGFEGLSQNGGVDMSHMEEMIRNMFGGGMGGMGGMHQQQEDKVPDVDITKEFTLEELYNGLTTTEQVERFSLCKKCNATGSSDGIEHKCVKCNGVGKSMKVMQVGPQMFQKIISSCDGCKGTGQSETVEKCKTCKGKRALKDKIELKFEIKPGGSGRNKIIITNEGNEIPVEERKNKNVSRSDVILHIQEKRHESFKRHFQISGKKDYVDPADLLYELKISLAESLCGLQKDINHINGKIVTIKHSEYLKDGDIIVVPRLGMPVYDNSKVGDLYVSVSVERPTLSSNVKNRLWQVLTETKYREVSKNAIDTFTIDQYQETINKKERKQARHNMNSQFVNLDEEGGRPECQMQ
jgi:DnaJ-class molecular chaperone